MSAFNSAGIGPATPLLSINSDDEIPVPRLLVVDQKQSDNVPLQKTGDLRNRHNIHGRTMPHSSVTVSDVDNGDVRIVSNKVTDPVGVAFVDNTVFWLEHNGPIMSSAMDGSNISVVSDVVVLGDFRLGGFGRMLYIRW